MPKAPITRLTGLDIQPQSVVVNGLSTIPNSKIHGLYVPNLTTAQIVTLATKSPAELRNGAIVYNTTTNTFQIYTSYITAAGITTSAWLPLGIPVMTAAQGAFFEAANTVPGQMYILSDTNIVRVYIAAWRSIATA